MNSNGFVETEDLTRAYSSGPIEVVALKEWDRSPPITPNLYGTLADVVIALERKLWKKENIQKNIYMI